MADQHRQQLHVQQLLTRIQELEAKEAQLDIEVVEWRRRKCNAMDEVGRLVEHCSDLTMKRALLKKMVDEKNKKLEEEDTTSFFFHIKRHKESRLLKKRGHKQQSFCCITGSCLGPILEQQLCSSKKETSKDRNDYRIYGDLGCQLPESESDGEYDTTQFDNFVSAKSYQDSIGEPPKKK